MLAAAQSNTESNIEELILIGLFVFVIWWKAIIFEIHDCESQMTPHSSISVSLYSFIFLSKRSPGETNSDDDIRNGHGPTRSGARSSKN